MGHPPLWCAPAANLLQCELFPGDFKRMLEMLVHVAVVWTRNKRLAAAGLPLANEGETQLARLLALLFQALERGGADVYAPHERLRSVLEVLEALGEVSPGGRVLRAALQPHVGSILRLLSSPAYQVCNPRAGFVVCVLVCVCACVRVCVCALVCVCMRASAAVHDE